LKRWWLVLCAAVAASACGEESPTEVGAGLLPVDAIQTFEVFLDADRYLVFDTAFGLYSAPADAEFAMLANAFEGVLHSRIVTRFGIPSSLIVTDTAGVQRVDSNPIFLDGVVQLAVDSLASTDFGEVRIHHTTETWDRFTADWTMRVDSPGVQLPWSQPGGSPGALISSADYVPGDTLEVPVDAATIALWADTLDATRGALITAATPGSRLRTAPPSLLLRVRSTHNPDTIYELRVTPPRTFIFTPELPIQSSTVRIGGHPAWRGVMRLRERLDTVTVACPTTPNCRVALGQVAISHAALMLQPQPPPPGFSPELSVQFTVHLLLPSPLVPLQRSPITEALAGTAAPVPVSRFLAPDMPLVELPITDVIGLAVQAPGAVPNEQRVSHIALLQAGTRTFGFAQFGERPQLRLILTMAKELQLP
jgi:hypothetical protein